MTPNKAPPMAEKISPFVGALNISEKFQPSPHKIKAPTKHKIAAIKELIRGFSLMRKNSVMGVAMTEKASRKTFLLVVVVSRPMNWKI